MISMPFSITVDYPFWPEDTCIHVVAMPHVIIYRIPRNHVQDLIGYEELKKAGIYLLTNTTKRNMYVGQADSRDNGNGILARMLEPHKQRVEIDQWDVGYAIICAIPNLLGATELNYLERYFYDEAKKVGKYNILNGSRPHASGVNNYATNNLNSFIPPALFLLERHVGFDGYVPLSSSITNSPVSASTKGKKVATTEQENSSEMQVDGTGDISAGEADNVYVNRIIAPKGPRYTLESKIKDVYAVGYYNSDDNSMLVEAGSRISKESGLDKKTGRMYQHKLREYLCSHGTIVDREFTEDYVFSSPDMAAAIIMGKRSQGKRAWKINDNESKKQNTVDEVKNNHKEANQEAINCEATHHMTSRGSDAYGKRSENGFVVLKGSKIAQGMTASYAMRNKGKHRIELEEKGIIKDGVFTCDWEFKTISGAASVVAGSSTNGNEAWKKL